MVQQIQTMIETNNINEPAQLTVQTFQIEDLSNKIDSFLSEKAKAALKVKANSTIYIYKVYPNDGAKAIDYLRHILYKFEIDGWYDLDKGVNYIQHVAPVNYFGCTVDPDHLDEALVKISNLINELAEKDFIRATLAAPQSIKLMNGKLAVITYLAIDDVNLNWVKSNYPSLLFNEGGYPTEL